MPPQAKSRRWTFTLNNPTEDDILTIQGAARGDRFRFLIYGRETGAAGTPHLQGYLELRDHQRLAGVKNLLGTERVHLEIARGTAAQNVEYCSKEDPAPYRYGEPGRGQGSRSDLLAVQAALDQGSTLRDVAESYFPIFVRYSKGFTLYQSLRAQPRNWRTQVVYIWGPTGSGKSRFAQQDAANLCGESVCWLPDQSCKWFDGYVPNTKGVILDDFDGSATLAFLLRLFDRYPLKVPIKGGFVEWNPRIVWITSNYPLEHWYKEGEHLNALLRRIDEIKHVQ